MIVMLKVGIMVISKDLVVWDCIWLSVEMCD